jgi:hypothetical protein
MSERSFMQTLKLSADTPEQLRRCDVYRVVESAIDQGFGLDFAFWLADLRPDLEDAIDMALEHNGKEVKLLAAYLARRDFPSMEEPGARLIGNLFGKPWRVQHEGTTFGLIRGYVVLTADHEAVEVIYACAGSEPVEIIDVPKGEFETALIEATFWLRTHGLPDTIEVPKLLAEPGLAGLLLTIKENGQ